MEPVFKTDAEGTNQQTQQLFLMCLPLWHKIYEYEEVKS